MRLDAASAAPAGTLPRTHLTLAIRDTHLDRLNVVEAVAKLPREDPELVAIHYDEFFLSRLERAEPIGRHGRLAEIVRAAHRPIRGRTTRGLSVEEAANQLGIPRAAFVALAEKHLLLELKPFGGKQKRRLATDLAIEAGIVWNVDATRSRIAHLEGYSKAVVFPVFSIPRLDDAAWMMDWPSIIQGVGCLPTRREKRDWLFREHDYLPDEVVGDLCGYTQQAVNKARKFSKTRKGKSFLL